MVIEDSEHGEDLRDRIIQQSKLNEAQRCAFTPIMLSQWCWSFGAGVPLQFEKLDTADFSARLASFG